MLRIEVTIDVIIHATEDFSKFFKAFELLFELSDQDFTIRHTTGHYDNPITTISAKLVKRQAVKFIEKLMNLLSKEQITEMIKNIEERTVDSNYHVRIDKQNLIKGKILFREEEAVKLKIYTPIYNKKNTVEIFSKIFAVN